MGDTGLGVRRESLLTGMQLSDLRAGFTRPATGPHVHLLPDLPSHHPSFNFLIYFFTF